MGLTQFPFGSSTAVIETLSEMLDAVTWLVAVSAGYLIGALPSGLIVARIWRRIDIRNYGSGSTGTTNVYRTLGSVAAGLTLLFDFVKGCAPVLAARLALSQMEVFAPDLLQAVVGIAAIAGHTWPVYVGFKGGKGIATGWGALLVMSPIAAATGIVGLLVIAITRLVSLGALIGAGVALLATVVLAIGFSWPFEHVIYTVIGCGLILFRHSGNINRLMEGTERRVEANPRPERADGPPRNRGE